VLNYLYKAKALHRTRCSAFCFYHFYTVWAMALSGNYSGSAFLHTKI